MGKASIQTWTSTQESFTTRWALTLTFSPPSLPWRGYQDGSPIGWNSCWKINYSVRTRSTQGSTIAHTCRSTSVSSLTTDLPLTSSSSELSTNQTVETARRQPRMTTSV